MKHEPFTCAAEPNCKSVLESGLVYLASQYFSDKPALMEERYKQALNATGALLEQGFTVYSPIVHYHPVAQEFDLPRDFAFWSAHNHKVLRRCSAMLVLETPTWLDSRGVCFELGVAKALNLPTFLTSPPDYLFRRL